MTVWNKSAVRHIPEEELHAYLDQALSRSQCVEIERHLARCQRCQDTRDEIAGLRDRTTELLARVGPPPILPPAFEVLKTRHAERLRQRWRWISNSAWAASLVGAVAFGWLIDRRTHHQPSPIVARPASPTRPEQSAVLSPAAAFGISIPTSHDESVRSEARLRRTRTSPDEPVAVPVRYAQAVTTRTDTFREPTALPQPASAVSSNADVPTLMAQPVGRDPGLKGLWRTILPDSGTSPPDANLPLVPGLPVVQLRVQPGLGNGDVTAVDQMLETGEVIRTIAGPAGRVGSLVDADPSAVSATDTQTDAGRMTVTIRQGDRMVAVTGPSQALGSLLSRVNVRKPRY